ncbi:MAG: UspA protein [Segetibacter sp.]|nr:UspA protein [Segetibacter sp.]
MKKILVPTDFSSNANKALDFAVQIAKQAEAEIVLVHACDLLSTTFKDHLAIKNEHNEALLDKANEHLAFLKKSIEDTEKVTVTIKIYNGNITDSILQASEENSADFIVIGTRGETELTERIFGSTTSGILGKTKVPLMVVTPLTEWEISVKPLTETIPGESGKFAPDAILFATNHFEENKELLNPIVDVAKLFSSTIHVAVFVDTDFAEAYDYVYNIGELHRYIEFLQKTYPGVSFKGELLEGEDFESTIEKYNDKNGVDIIAMITYPKTFWDRLLKKSVTKEMAFYSKIPVMAITAK